MDILTGWGSRVRGLFTDTKGPWGPTGNGEDEESPQGTGPWGEPAKGKRRSAVAGDTPSLEDFLRRSRARFGGGGGLPGRPDRSIIACCGSETSKLKSPHSRLVAASVWLV